MPFQINGLSASLAPYRQEWQDNLMGRDHSGRPIYAATKAVKLEFDSCTQASYNQWSQFHGASLHSVQILNLDGTSFSTYTSPNLFIEIDERPSFEANYVGPWSALVSGIAVS